VNAFIPEPDAMPSPLDLIAFRATLVEAAKALDARRPHLAALEGAREVLLYTYGTRGKDLALQLRAAGVRCVVYDNSPKARALAESDGFEVTLDLSLGLPLIVAAGQNQIEILGEVSRPAWSLAEALYALDLRNSYGPARAFTDRVVGDAETLHAIYASLDARAATVFLDVLRYRASLDVHQLVHRRPVGEMWLPPIDGLGVQSFCDIGAYDGDSLAATKAVFPDLARALAIEPSAAMVEPLTAMAERLGVETRIYTGAAWDRRTRLGARLIFNGMLVIEENAAGDIETDRLDALSAGEIYDYVKMDVEGGEAKVIAGGIETLRRARCVAVAAYHLPGDLIDLHRQLAAVLGEGWRASFSHYSQSFDDSILYFHRP
jgi:FkbM family methyltransferase